LNESKLKHQISPLERIEITNIKLVLLSEAKRTAHCRAATLPKRTSCCCTCSATKRKIIDFSGPEAKLGKRNSGNLGKVAPVSSFVHVFRVFRGYVILKALRFFEGVENNCLVITLPGQKEKYQA
jgi:hypothetical protein